MCPSQLLFSSARCYNCAQPGHYDAQCNNEKATLVNGDSLGFEADAEAFEALENIQPPATD
jgi:hypothetical protein